MLNRGALVFSLALVCGAMYDEVAAKMPAPFTKVLFLKKPSFEGKQIYTMQCSVDQLTVTRKWGFKTDVTAVHNGIKQLQCGLQLTHTTYM